MMSLDKNEMRCHLSFPAQWCAAGGVSTSHLSEKGVQLTLEASGAELGLYLFGGT